MKMNPSTSNEIGTRTHEGGQTQYRLSEATRASQTGRSKGQVSILGEALVSSKYTTERNPTGTAANISRVKRDSNSPHRLGLEQIEKFAVDGAPRAKLEEDSACDCQCADDAKLSAQSYSKAAWSLPPKPQPHTTGTQGFVKYVTVGSGASLFGHDYVGCY